MKVNTTARSDKQSFTTDFIFCLTQKYNLQTEQQCGTHFKKLANMIDVDCVM